MRPDNAGDEGPGRPADDDEALSDTMSEDVEMRLEDKETELVTSPVDELEGPSTAPLDIELADPGIETLKLSVLLRLETPRDPDSDTAPVDEADNVPPLEVGKPELIVSEAEFPGRVIDASVLCSELAVG